MRRHCNLVKNEGLKGGDKGGAEQSGYRGCLRSVSTPYAVEKAKNLFRTLGPATIFYTSELRGVPSTRIPPAPLYPPTTLWLELYIDRRGSSDSQLTVLHKIFQHVPYFQSYCSPTQASPHGLGGA